MIMLMQVVQGEEITEIFDSKTVEGLIQKLTAENQEAFGKLYELIDDAVYGYALSILKNSHEAEDVLHDCFLSIWHNASSYKPQGKPMAWIFTIVRNLCLMRLRKNNATVDIPDEDWENNLSEKKGVSIEDRLVLEACIKELNSEERDILLLHALAGLKHREISELIGSPLSTVLSKYKRTLEKLRKLLEQGDKSDD